MLRLCGCQMSMAFSYPPSYNPHQLMKGVYSLLLLTISNLFMTFAWYGYLHLFKKWPGLPSWVCLASS